jgi:cation:H+ antiporter
MFLQISLLILGFILLIKGAGWLVDGASALAKQFNISDLAIGLTVVAFGTSAPELVVNTFASFQNHQDIVLGNIIGSNFFNLFAILGIAGLIAPLAVKSSTVWKEIPFSLFAVILLVLLANNFFNSGSAYISRFDGLILLLFFIFFLYYVYKQLKTEKLVTETNQKKLSNLNIWVYLFAGLFGLILGGKLVVNSAIFMAGSFGVSEKIIGLTIVAAGTSLPELATSVVAVLKRNNDIAVGNVIGSNIFNILLILPVSAIIRPVMYKIEFNTELFVLAGGTIFLFIAMFTGERKKLDRWEAGVLFAIFIIYTTVLIAF